MPNGWMEAASNAGQSAIGGVIGLALGGIENRRQLEQQERLNQLSYDQHKLFTDYNTRAQMEMWRNTNYSAQMAELKKAGLNPGLMYGHGGPGGSLQAATGGGGNSQATRANDGIAGMGMGMQLAMMGAQKRLLEAQATKAEAEAAKTSGVDTTEAQNRIAEIAASIGNKNASTALMKIESEIKSIEKEVAGRTVEDAIDIITNEASRSTFEALRVQRQNNIEGSTINEVIGTIKAEYIGALLTNALTRQQTKTEVHKTYQTQEEGRAIGRRILQEYQRIEQEGRRITNEEIRRIAEVGGSNAGEDLINAVQSILLLRAAAGGTGPKPVGGFKVGK